MSPYERGGFMKLLLMKIKICFYGLMKEHYKCMVLKHDYYKNKVESTSNKIVNMKKTYKDLAQGK